MDKYQIRVFSVHEDPEDWCCNCVDRRDYLYNNGQIFEKKEAEDKIKWLRENKNHISHGGFDFTYLYYELQKYIT